VEKPASLPQPHTPANSLVLTYSTKPSPTTKPGAPLMQSHRMSGPSRKARSALLTQPKPRHFDRSNRQSYRLLRSGETRFSAPTACSRNRFFLYSFHKTVILSEVSRSLTARDAVEGPAIQLVASTGLSRFARSEIGVIGEDRCSISNSQCLKPFPPSKLLIPFTFQKTSANLPRKSHVKPQTKITL